MPGLWHCMSHASIIRHTHSKQIPLGHVEMLDVPRVPTHRVHNLSLRFLTSAVVTFWTIELWTLWSKLCPLHPHSQAEPNVPVLEKMTAFGDGVFKVFIIVKMRQECWGRMEGTWASKESAWPPLFLNFQPLT